MKLEENIARMEQELADMKKQLEQQDKLELKSGDGYCIYTSTKIFRREIPSVDEIQRGAFRATKELAEIADKNMVTRNLLEAYVHLIQGDGEGKYTVSKLSDGVYIDTNSIFHTVLGAVHMQKETAVILCEALNKGEIEL